VKSVKPGRGRGGRGRLGKMGPQANEVKFSHRKGLGLTVPEVGVKGKWGGNKVDVGERLWGYAREAPGGVWVGVGGGWGGWASTGDLRQEKRREGKKVEGGLSLRGRQRGIRRNSPANLQAKRGKARK